MKYLIDTQIFIWAMEGNKRLLQNVKAKISDPQNEVFVSVATLWEIIIKKRKGLKVPKNILGTIEESNISLLSINSSHVLGIEKLPNIHKDPFDRIIVSQARTEKLTLVSSDEKIYKYKVKVLKC